MTRRWQQKADSELNTWSTMSGGQDMSVLSLVILSPQVYLKAEFVKKFFHLQTATMIAFGILKLSSWDFVEEF